MYPLFSIRATIDPGTTAHGFFNRPFIKFACPHREGNTIWCYHFSAIVRALIIGVYTCPPLWGQYHLVFTLVPIVRAISIVPPLWGQYQLVFTLVPHCEGNTIWYLHLSIPHCEGKINCPLLWGQYQLVFTLVTHCEGKISCFFTLVTHCEGNISCFLHLSPIVRAISVGFYTCCPLWGQYQLVFTLVAHCEGNNIWCCIYCAIMAYIPFSKMEVNLQ